MTQPYALSRSDSTSPAASTGRQNTVKRRLTSRRTRRVVENDDYAAFARRLLRAYSRRVATGDIDALNAMTDLAAEIDTVIGQAVTGLRSFGYSWAEIGARLGPGFYVRWVGAALLPGSEKRAGRRLGRAALRTQTVPEAERLAVF